MFKPRLGAWYACVPPRPNVAPVLQYFRALRVTSVTTLNKKQKTFFAYPACANFVHPDFFVCVLCVCCGAAPPTHRVSLWPNWTRRLTTNQKIGGSSPSRDKTFFILFSPTARPARPLERQANIVRSYHDESTASHPNCEVKHRWARSVLQLGTMRESRVLYG